MVEIDQQSGSKSIERGEAKGPEFCAVISLITRISLYLRGVPMQLIDRSS